LNLSELQRTLVKEAYASYFHTPTNAQKAFAKEVMQDCGAPATAVLIAAKHLLGPTFISYEPETLWLELDPCHSNRDKLMAAIALSMTPSFYWDYRVFGATVHAFNDEMVSPEEVPRCTPEQMAWGAFEAELVYAMTDGESSLPEFDDCVNAYITTILLDNGFVVPPSGLVCCEDEFAARLNGEAARLREATIKAWAELPKEKVEQKKFDDDALGAQLEKLADCWHYVTEKTKQLRSYLAKL
jgi:hypothetical protein